MLDLFHLNITLLPTKTFAQIQMTKFHCYNQHIKENTKNQ